MAIDYTLCLYNISIFSSTFGCFPSGLHSNVTQVICLCSVKINSDNKDNFASREVF